MQSAHGMLVLRCGDPPFAKFAFGVATCLTKCQSGSQVSFLSTYQVEPSVRCQLSEGFFRRVLVSGFSEAGSGPHSGLQGKVWRTKKGTRV